jgi:fumarate reductase flavoprotein subunit
LNEKFNIPLYISLETVKKYNEGAKKVEDKGFGKEVTKLKAVEQPPFWASPTQAGVHHTMGGLRTKGATGQVLDRHGNVIPRLYAAEQATPSLLLSRAARGKVGT